MLILKKFVLELLTSRVFNSSVRTNVLGLFGLEGYGKNTVHPYVHFSNPDLSTVVMGDNSFINNGCFIDNSGRVVLGADVSLAPKVTILTSTHEIGSRRNRSGECVTKEVIIHNGTWVCAGVTILPGVTIGSGCVIAAGAVVNKDCEPNGLYAGVPAKRIRDLD